MNLFSTDNMDIPRIDSPKIIRDKKRILILEYLKIWNIDKVIPED